MAKRKTTSKPKGRPKGSRNKAYSQARSLRIPPACPNCKGLSLSPVPGAPKIRKKLSGEIEGVSFRAVEWQRCRCDQCGQYIMVRTYELTK